MIMLEQLAKPEVIVALLTILGGCVLALKRLNYIHFGGRTGCPDPKCQNNVQQMGARIETIEDTQSEIHKKVNKAANDIAYIKGRIDAALNNGK